MGYYHPFVYEVDMNTNHKLLIARINDLFSLCDKHCEMKCSDFLDGGELAFFFAIPLSSGLAGYIPAGFLLFSVQNYCFLPFLSAMVLSDYISDEVSLSNH